MKPLRRKTAIRPSGTGLAIVSDPRFDSAAAVAIPDRKALLALEPAVVRSIGDEFNAGALAARLCPVLLADQSVALFALREHVGSDQADALVRRVVAKGYVMACPGRYVLDAPLLLSVARNALHGGTEPDVNTLPRHSRTALADAFQDLIEWGVRHGASDLHLNILRDEAESEVRFTIRGRYVAPDRFRHMSTRMLADMLAVAWMDIRGGNGALFDPRIEQQGSLLRRVDGRDVVIRWASLAADEGPSVCLRLLVRGIQVAENDLATLGYLPCQVATIDGVMASEGGAIVFAGRVGSGKSTTLATLIAGLPADRKVITLEDPAEYRIPNAIQNTVSRTLSETQPHAYAAKLLTVKRSAMSDVLLGEIRDIESGQAFMDLAGSGVNVYTTLHAGSAATIPDRLASDFIGISRDFLCLPTTLRLLVFQTLLPRLCDQCSLPASRLLDGFPTPRGVHRAGSAWGRWLETIQTLYQIDVTSMRIRNPAGCGHCGVGAVDALKGYGGRTVAAELIETGVEHDFMVAVRERRVGQWARGRSHAVARKGLQARDLWRNAMDVAVEKSLGGSIDPRDIEHHFQLFETRLRENRAFSGWHADAVLPACHDGHRDDGGPDG